MEKCSDDRSVTGQGLAAISAVSLATAAARGTTFIAIVGSCGRCAR